MKLINKFICAGAILMAFGLVGCSSSEPQYLVQEKKPMAAESESIQEQTEVKPKSEYTDEDWFYDYYDLTEEEKEKLKNK